MTRHSTYKKMLARRPELSAGEEMRLQRHLHECAECRATAADYARQTALLRSLPVVPAPPSLRAGVFQGIQLGTTTTRPALPLRWAAPLAAALLIALAAVAYVNHSTKRQSSRAALVHQSPLPRPGAQPTPAPPATAAGPLQVLHPTQQPSRPRARRIKSTAVPASGSIPPGNASSIAQALPVETPGPSYGAPQSSQSVIDRPAPVHPHPPIASRKESPHKAPPHVTTTKPVSPVPAPAPVPSPLPASPVVGGAKTRPTPTPTPPVVVFHIKPTPVPAQPPPAYPTPPPAPASRPTPVAAAPINRPASPVPTPTPPS